MVTQLGFAESFSFGRNGMMTRNKRVHIHKGTKIYAYGYAMSLQYFVVYDENMNAVEICNGDPADVDKYDLECYFSPLQTLSEETAPISKKFGIGFYYDESDEIISDEIIEKSLQRAENLENLRKQIEEEKATEYEKNKKSLLEYYNYLERSTDKYDHKIVGKNLRILLKKKFPGVKFSIRKEGYDCYRITWKGGPTEEEVNPWANLFKTGRFDGYTDYHYSEDTPFTDLFGGVDYIFTYRYRD